MGDLPVRRPPIGPPQDMVGEFPVHPELSAQVQIRGQCKRKWKNFRDSECHAFHSEIDPHLMFFLLFRFCKGRGTNQHQSEPTDNAGIFYVIPLCFRFVDTSNSILCLCKPDANDLCPIRRPLVRPRIPKPGSPEYRKSTPMASPWHRVHSSQARPSPKRDHFRLVSRAGARSAAPGGAPARLKRGGQRGRIPGRMA